LGPPIEELAPAVYERKAKNRNEIIPKMVTRGIPAGLYCAIGD